MPLTGSRRGGGLVEACRELVVPILLVATLSSGCLTGASGRPLGSSCSSTEECEAPFVCAYGRCRSGCVLDRDCPGEGACVAAPGGGRVCITREDSAGCAVDGGADGGADGGGTGCPPGLVCGPDGLCRDRCSPSDPCERDYYCVEGACVEGIGCGDGRCVPPENAEVCRLDCLPTCGDGLCGGAEDAESCPLDCEADCGDGACTHLEDAASCPLDCGPDCGDGACTHLEDAASCPQDCEPDCGDGACTHLEDAASCPGDCRQVLEISAGANHTCAVLAGGLVRCWGNCEQGRLGFPPGDPSLCSHYGDTEVPAAAPVVDLGGDRAVAVAAGSLHSCALTEAGAVRCWGNNGHGVLGLGNLALAFADDPAAHPPVELGGAAVGISAGDLHTCAVMAAGELRCWGSNVYGRLGIGWTVALGDDEHPVEAAPVDLGQPVRQVSAGTWHSCAVLDDGTLRCWGDGGYGQLGIGDPAPYGGSLGDDEAVLSAPAVRLGPVLQVACGGMHTCALLETGQVFCWGLGSTGQLGLGDEMSLDAPSATAVEVGGPAVAIEVGDQHSCAIRETGEVVCWGLGESGRLGYGNLALVGDDELPLAAGRVPLPAPAGQLVLGGSHSCVRESAFPFEVRCWGSSFYGQIGYPPHTTAGDGLGPGVETLAPVVLVP